MATKFITVNIDIMHDQNLSQSQKFILAEIEQLSSLENGCIASNQHFSSLIGITKENVSRNVNNLMKKGYIDIKIEPGSRNHTRLITLTKTVRPPYQNSKTRLLKQQETKENKQINIQSNIQEYVTLWNELCENSPLSPVKTLSKARKEKILKREKDDPSFKHDFEAIIYEIAESEFLNGGNEQGWKVSFDWIFHNDINYLKILEGNYSNTKVKVKKPVNNTNDLIDQMFEKEEVLYAELA